MSRYKSTRPHTWIIGPDPVEHDYYNKWLQQRNQAQWRGEDWQLPFEDWRRIWGTDIVNRGRLKGQLSMIRRDYRQPWTPDNVILVTREEQAVIQHLVTEDKRRRKKATENSL